MSDHSLTATEAEKPPTPTLSYHEKGEQLPPAPTDRSVEEGQEEAPAPDPNIVDWDGPDDPENPLNWPRPKRLANIALISIFVLSTNLAATMYAPGASALALEFHVTSHTVVLLTVSLYVLGFAIGPLILAPLSELYGRLVIYMGCLVVYIAFTLGCAFSTDVAMFIVFRFIAGCAAAGPMTVGGGSIADMSPPEERGKAMGVFALGPLLGPVLGPLIGGFVSQYCGWRWTFRILVIMAGVVGVTMVLFGRESHAVTLLERKAARLRKETGNPDLVSKLALKETPGQMMLRSIVRPIKMLIFSPVVLLVSLYGGVIFGLIFLLLSTFSDVFMGIYGFSEGTSGLAYLGLGLGMFLGLLTFSALSDRILKWKKDQGDDKPENRLIPMMWFGPITPLGCFMYGWSAYYHTHWIVPIIGSFIIGFGALFVIIPAQIYFVDMFGAMGAASALAANLLIRCPFGAFLDLASVPLYNNLKMGWGNSTLGFVCLAFTPVPWLFYRYGKMLRERFVVTL